MLRRPRILCVLWRRRLLRHLLGVTAFPGLRGSHRLLDCLLQDLLDAGLDVPMGLRETIGKLVIPRKIVLEFMFLVAQLRVHSVVFQLLESLKSCFLLWAVLVYLSTIRAANHFP